MDWITGIQRAIDYIEEHLTEELDYAEIAGRAYVSSFHFQRIFAILCGFTLGEYIRNRRLTLAGAALSQGDAKVIDVALKYGYDSPDSFAKAFTRFHGVTPSAAREPGVRLRSFSRLSIRISLEGGNAMDCKIEKRPAFKVAGKAEIFKLMDEYRRDDIPAFWARCQQDGTVQALYRASYGTKEPGVVYGVCYDGDTVKNEFSYIIAAPYEKGDIPDGCRVYDIPERTWAIFRCVGAMPRAIQELWKRIYTEYFPTSDYRPAHGIDLEAYYEGNMDDERYASEIWIPVERK